MTPSIRLRAALTRLRWSYGDLAAETGVSDGTTRRWGNGTYPVPDEVLAPLERLAEFHAANPLPRRLAAE